MHRDVKPHNVMIDHEHRKVPYPLLLGFLTVDVDLATTNRLGPS